MHGSAAALGRRAAALSRGQTKQGAKPPRRPHFQQAAVPPKRCASYAACCHGNGPPSIRATGVPAYAPHARSSATSSTRKQRQAAAAPQQQSRSCTQHNISSPTHARRVSSPTGGISRASCCSAYFLPTWTRATYKRVAVSVWPGAMRLATNAFGRTSVRLPGRDRILGILSAGCCSLCTGSRSSSSMHFRAACGNCLGQQPRLELAQTSQTASSAKYSPLYG